MSLSGCESRTVEWTLELVARRGRRMGFAGADLDDAVQEVAPVVLGFRFDEARCNGASLRTVLVAIIDRRLRTIRQRESRYASRLQRAREAKYPAPGIGDEPQEPSYCDTAPLVIDVRAALEALSERDREICEFLGHGYSVREVADRLGCDWHTVRRSIARIRDRFAEMGLDGWLESA